MAKNILGFFGGLSILFGFVIIGLSYISIVSINNRLPSDSEFFAIAVLSSVFLLAGAPLLAMARIIGLLEKIEINTRQPKEKFVADDGFKKALSSK